VVWEDITSTSSRLSKNNVMIKNIQETVSIPVMAKCRIGHFAEAQILEALEVDFIDESEVLTPADDNNHIYKHDFKLDYIFTEREIISSNQ